MCYLETVNDHDPVIERLESEILESRFSKWDVETLLADRHQAKIEALTKPRNKWGARWQVAKEIGLLALAYIGFAATSAMLGVYLLG